MSDNRDNRDNRGMEAALVDYIERYGLTEKARELLFSQNRKKPKVKLAGGRCRHLWLVEQGRD